MAYVYSTSTESPFERYWYFHKYTMCKGNRGHDQVTSRESVSNLGIRARE